MPVSLKYLYPFIMCCLALSHTIDVCAQDTLPPPAKCHTIFLEVLGGGGYGSLNYEQVVYHQDKLKINARLGISTYKVKDFELNFNPDIIIPFSAGIVYGQKHNIEIALGQTFSSVSEINLGNFAPARKNNVSAFGMIAYRIQFNKPAIMLRLAYSPVFEFYNNWQHWAGLSFGYAF